MNVKHFFDKNTSTLTYILWDEKTRDAIIIDPVLDYDQASSSYWTESIDKLIEFIKGKELKVHLLLETHAHADHISGAHELKKQLPEAKIGVGNQITVVQKVFKSFFNFGKDFKTNGSQFDLLFKDGEEVEAGSLNFKIIHTPGHTPACVSYLFEDTVFTGDALFMPDSGVARCDFPEGSAKTLYHSVHNKLYNLPNETKVFTGHDYQPNGRELQFETTIGESKERNIHLRQETTEDNFIKLRTERDKSLAAPKLLLPSVQINIAAGEFPPADKNGISYLRLPLRSRE